MHKKNLLVYLHGKGGNKSSHMPLIRKIAAKLDAEILAPDAPFPHKSGYKWFDKAEYDGRLQMKAGDFNKSIDYILTSRSIILSMKRRRHWTAGSVHGTGLFSAAIRKAL